MHTTHVHRHEADGFSLTTAQFVQNIWIESYDPTIEDSYRKTLEVDVRRILVLSIHPYKEVIQLKTFNRDDK
jgi:hypothetical protein